MFHPPRRCGLRKRLCAWQAPNGGAESHQRSAVKQEVDANHDTNEESAGYGPIRQKVDAENYGDYAGKDCPPPPGKLNDTRPGCPE
jgi:hypothetical protein